MTNSSYEVAQNSVAITYSRRMKMAAAYASESFVSYGVVKLHYKAESHNLEL